MISIQPHSQKTACFGHVTMVSANQSLSFLTADGGWDGFLRIWVDVDMIGETSYHLPPLWT